MTGRLQAVGRLGHDPWAVRIGRAIAAGRVALGLVAVAAPELPGRPWIGEAASGRLQAVVLRGLGARDVALGLGALRAPAGGELQRWLALGALADLADATTTISAFGSLPRRTRWLVLGACAGAALAGGAAAVLSGGADAGSPPRAGRG